MQHDASPNRWFHAWRPQTRLAQPDLADLGTAFGLDASFGDTPPAPPHAPPPAKTGWMQRLSARGKRSA